MADESHMGRVRLELCRATILRNECEAEVNGRRKIDRQIPGEKVSESEASQVHQPRLARVCVGK